MYVLDEMDFFATKHLCCFHVVWCQHVFMLFGAEMCNLGSMSGLGNFGGV